MTRWLQPCALLTDRRNAEEYAEVVTLVYWIGLHLVSARSRFLLISAVWFMRRLAFNTIPTDLGISMRDGDGRVGGT